MEKSIIIVGAGISGVSAGFYARMNGYKVSLFEMNAVPGGLCAAWKRNGYTWDISMHMLMNSHRGPFRRMWEELGVVGEQKFHYHTEFMRLEGSGKKLVFGSDRRAVEEAMLALSPADAEAIKKFTALLYGRGMAGMASLKPPELSNLADAIKMFAGVLPFIRMIVKYYKTTHQELAGWFKDPFLQTAVRFLIDSPGWPMLRFPALAVAGFIKAGMVNSGVPIGGSQQVVAGIADRFQKLGGAIFYRKTVKDLIIENNRVAGIRLDDGTEHRADTVIWAADGHHLIFDLLQGRYVSDGIRSIYENWIPVKPLVHVAIGVNRDMSAEPHRLLLEIDKPILVADEEHRWLSVINHSYDPTLAPPGKSSIEVWFATDYDYWATLSHDRERYLAEKKRIADQTIAALDKRWPGFASQVEVVDVPTPATYVRYTGTWRGSPDGWYITPENIRTTGMQRSLPGLADLYMIGQWTAPFTGTVNAALSGRQVVQIICKKEKRRFRTV
jgi:phytoene dehydrogenase-like protein